MEALDMFANIKTFKSAFKSKIMALTGKTLEESSSIDKYVVLATMIRETVNEKWANTNAYYLENGERQVYYFSLEFLLGKFLESNLIYLGVRDVCEQGLLEMDIDLEEIIAVEPDAGLGNGGLGRLAACFLDSMASMGLPGHGCGIRYKYGLFTQKIIGGYQVELPDNWLRDVNAWEIRRPDKSILVKFGGQVRYVQREDGGFDFAHEDFLPVMAVPYDMPIMGYRNNTVNTLRLWSAEAAEGFDFASFSRGDYINAVSNKYSVEAISEVLYPDDSNYTNRILRLKQQYFFVSAGVQSIVRRFKKKQKDIRKLADMICIHVNDTHPVLVIPELMRIFVDEEEFTWEDAWEMTRRIVAYTNHTIMPEALEKWPVDLFKSLLPRIYMIVEEIDRRYRLELEEAYPDDQEKAASMTIIGDGVVRMANLAVVGSFSVNGVAAVHTDILKSFLMKDMHEFYPGKFNNKTNGITHRRWLIKANPELARLITETTGEGWIRDPIQLRGLLKHGDDPQLLAELGRIKRTDKERLAAYVLRNMDILIDPDSIFDVQVKRIHAYKRQLLNALHVQYLYNRLKDDSTFDIVPRTFIIGGKAAPSYYYAKNIIKYISELSELINHDPDIKGKLKLVFLENYNISVAEIIFPASDVSEQISTASKEASGTGNMKFMLNGALTVGTMDGANIEIHGQVGDSAFYQFGLTVDEVLAYYAGGGYNARWYYENDERIKLALDQMMNGVYFPDIPHDEFQNITRSLLEYNDEFFVLRDFDGYAEVQQRVDTDYRDKTAWARKSLRNIAMSGVFSSDNTISQYATEIWDIHTCNPMTAEE